MICSVEVWFFSSEHWVLWVQLTDFLRIWHLFAGLGSEIWLKQHKFPIHSHWPVLQILFCEHYTSCFCFWWQIHLFCIGESQRHGTGVLGQQLTSLRQSCVSQPQNYLNRLLTSCTSLRLLWTPTFWWLRASRWVQVLLRAYIAPETIVTSLLWLLYRSRNCHHDNRCHAYFYFTVVWEAL